MRLEKDALYESDDEEDDDSDESFSHQSTPIFIFDCNQFKPNDTIDGPAIFF